MPDRAEAGEWLSLSVPTRTEYMGTVRSFVGSVGAHYGLTTEQIEDLKLAVSEICGDASESPSDRRISVSIVAKGSSLDVEVSGVGRLGSDGTRDLDDYQRFRRRLIDALIPNAAFTPADQGAAVSFSVRTTVASDSNG